MSYKSVNMVSVSSSNLDSVGYDEDNFILYVRFLNGSEYVYKSVPKKVYEELLKSTSKGSFLHKYIKNKYPYEKIK